MLFEFCINRTKFVYFFSLLFYLNLMLIKTGNLIRKKYCAKILSQERSTFAGSSNYPTRCSNGRDSRRGVTSGREREGGEETKFISSLPRRYRGRCDARFPPGKKSIAIRKLAPPNDDIHPPPPRRRAISSSPSLPHEFLGIPRLVTGGGDRVRFAISPTSTSPRQRQPDNQPPRTPRHRRGPETFGDTGEEEEGRGLGGYIKCIKYGGNPAHVPFARRISR